MQAEQQKQLDTRRSQLASCSKCKMEKWYNKRVLELNKINHQNLHLMKCPAQKFRATFRQGHSINLSASFGVGGATPGLLWE